MAEKKISELPIVVDNIYKISDSDVVAMVSASTTAQITIKTLRDKITEFAAKTGSANTFTGNQIVNGSVTITGKLTVNDIETIYQTSSVVFSSGSNKFGDQSSDKHEFTGSVAMTGSLIVNGDSVNIGTLNSFTSSQLGVNVGNSIVTASFNAFTSSQLGVNVGISIVSASFNSFSSSQLGVNVGNSIVTSSLNNFTSSQLGVNVGVSIVTSSFNSFTSSQLGVNVEISIVTASFNEHSRSINERVADIQFYTSSVKVEIGQILAYTASVNTFTASGKIDVANIQAYTASVKEEISQLLSYTASVKETITQTLAYTSSVKTEIGQIVSYTSSLNSYTQSAKIDVANIQAYTASVKNEVANIQAYTASVKNEIGQIVAYTSSLNSYTQSAKIDVANIQAYTASLKVAGIVSSSSQISNYYKFAETASSNTFYGNQTIQGNLQLSSTSPLVYNAGNTNAMLFGLFDGSSIYGPYYQIFGSNYSNVSQRGSAEFVFDSRNGGFSGFNVAEFNGSTWLRKFRVSPYGAEVTGSLVVTNGITGSLNGTADNAKSIDIFTTNTDVDAYPLFTNVIGTTGVSVLGDNNLRYNAFSNTLTLTGTISATTYLGDIVSSSAQIGEIVRLQQATASLNTFTGSIRDEVSALESYTASLKAAAIVSSSTQIQNYFLFAQTSSANTFYGNQKVKGNFDVDNKVSVTGSLIVSSSANQLWATPEFQLYNGLGTVNFALTPNTGNQLQIQAYGTKAEITQANEPLRLLTPTLQMVKYDNTPTKVEVTGSANITGSLTINSGSITMPNRPAFRVVGTSSTDRVAQTILSGSYTSVDYNEGNHYNNSTGLFTAPIAGLYNVYFNGRVGSVNAQHQVIIYKNGAAGTAQLMWESAGNTGATHFGVSGIVKLAVNDTLEANVTIGSIQFDGNDNFGATYIG